MADGSLWPSWRSCVSTSGTGGSRRHTESEAGLRHPAEVQAQSTELDTGVTTTQELVDILRTAKHLAKRYRALTGRPLGLTGEIGEYEAIRLLGLTPAVVRQAGFDATRSQHGRTNASR
jgi:hypothetical protein